MLGALAVPGFGDAHRRIVERIAYTQATIAQLIDGTGRVHASSEDADRTPLLTGPELRRARQAKIALTATVDGDPERLMAAAFGGRSESRC